MSEPISILLADDHTLVRQTLRSRLDIEPDLTVVADVGNADEAISQARSLMPQVVLMDIDMPGTLCFEAARTITTHCPQTRVMFLSSFTNDCYIEQALAAEASAYITKTEPPEVLIRAIRTVVSGATYYSPDVQSRIIVDDRQARLASRPHTRATDLSRREVEVLRYIASGLPKKQIAAAMHLSLSTIDAHTTRLMSKLHIHDRVELARFAIREGMVNA